MSDNITEEEMWRRYVLFMRIPNETWTDVLKLFPRRILVQKILPVCKRLKNICDRNVQNIHVVTEADEFHNKLLNHRPEAIQQLEHLAGNNCQLASQFRLTEIHIIQENLPILRHCIELFQGCRLSFWSSENNQTLIDECFTQLERAKPIAIDICLIPDPKLLINRSLRHPTVWNCNRIGLNPWSDDAMPLAVTFLDWLHHQQQIGIVDGDGADDQGEVRCLIIKTNYGWIQGAIDWLINACVQNLQESQGPKDRRRFVLSFYNWKRDRDEATRLGQFERSQNQATGEVLLLEHVDVHHQEATVYRLRRCLAEEVDSGNEFYEKTFKQCGPWDEFAATGNDGPFVDIDHD